MFGKMKVTVLCMLQWPLISSCPVSGFHDYSVPREKNGYDTQNCKGCAPAACYNRVWKKVHQRWEKEAVLFLLRYNHMIRFPNDCIWGTGKSKGQVFIHVQSDFPFILYTFFNFFYHSHDMIITRLLNGNRTPIDRAAKRIFGPQGKRKLSPSSNSPNNDTQTKSNTVHVISKESVQQKWIDELWFRKQLSTCLFVWTLNYNSWAPADPPSQWACQSILKRHFDLYFDIRLVFTRYDFVSKVKTR